MSDQRGPKPVRKVGKEQKRARRTRQIAYLVHELCCKAPGRCTYRRDMTESPPNQNPYHCDAVVNCVALASEIMR